MIEKIQTDAGIEFDEFRNSVKEKKDKYVESKNYFSEFDFQNLELAETEDTPNSNEKNSTVVGKKTELLEMRDTPIPNKKKKPLSFYYSRAIEALFNKVMKHFEAGQDYDKIYETIYAYPSTEEDDYKKYISLLDEESIIRSDESIVPANLNKEYIEKLLAELGNRALEIQSDPSDRVSNTHYARFFLLGDMGTGKTAFLNNIFSRYHLKLKKNKIFWIRVDMTKFPFKGQMLLESLNFQLAKIFKAHYFNCLSEQEKLNLKSSVSKHFLIEGIEDIHALNIHYNHFCITPYQREEMVIDTRVQQGIKDYVEQNYGVINIFDGLDRIDTDVKLFKKKLLDIKKILGSEKYQGVFVFVMRYASHRNYLESLLPSERVAQTNLRNNKNKVFKIVPPKLDEIINGRIDLLLSKQDTYFPNIAGSIYPRDILPSDRTDDDKNKVREVGKRISQQTKNNYEAYLNVFLMFLYEGITKEELDIKNWDRKIIFTELKNLFGYDYRKLLSIIKSSNEIFLKVIENLNNLNFQIENIFEIGNAINNKNMEQYENHKKNLESIRSKSYLILDFLLLRGNIRFKNPYKYEYNNKGVIKWKTENIENEVPYLYNLYYAVNVKDRKEGYYNLLLKIRILQYVSINKDKNVQKNDIADFLHTHFTYSKECTLLAFEELYDWRLITNDFEKNNTSFDYVYKLSRAGEYHLQTLIYQFSYIRLIIDDILVPKQFCNLFNDIPNGDTGKKRAEKIIRQFPKIINFISMIKSIEQKEMEKSQMDKIEKSQWIISNKLEEMNLEVFAKILWRDDRSLNLLDEVLNRNITTE
jgi:hypothetical protein